MIPTKLEKGMTPDEFIKGVMRTECNQDRSSERMLRLHLNPPHKMVDPIRVNHAVLGMCSEAGELASVLMKWLYYGAQDDKPFDATKFKDELGDLLWSTAQLCDALGFTFEEVMESNNRKLRTRFPEKYSDEAIANKDRDAEQEAVDGKYFPGVGHSY